MTPNYKLITFNKNCLNCTRFQFFINYLIILAKPENFYPYKAINHLSVISHLENSLNNLTHSSSRKLILETLCSCKLLNKEDPLILESNTIGDINSLKKLIEKELIPNRSISLLKVIKDKILLTLNSDYISWAFSKLRKCIENNGGLNKIHYYSLILIAEFYRLGIDIIEIENCIYSSIKNGSINFEELKESIISVSKNYFKGTLCIKTNIIDDNDNVPVKFVLGNLTFVNELELKNLDLINLKNITDFEIFKKNHCNIYCITKINSKSIWHQVGEMAEELLHYNTIAYKHYYTNIKFYTNEFIFLRGEYSKRYWKNIEFYSSYLYLVQDLQMNYRSELINSENLKKLHKLYSLMLNPNDQFEDIVYGYRYLETLANLFKNYSTLKQESKIIQLIQFALFNATIENQKKEILKFIHNSRYQIFFDDKIRDEIHDNLNDTDSFYFFENIKKYHKSNFFLELKGLINSEIINKIANYSKYIYMAMYEYRNSKIHSNIVIHDSRHELKNLLNLIITYLDNALCNLIQNDDFTSFEKLVDSCNYQGYK